MNADREIIIPGLPSKLPPDYPLNYKLSLQTTHPSFEEKNICYLIQSLRDVICVLDTIGHY